MEKRFYTIEVLGKKNKRIGQIQDYLTQDEMALKCDGILTGAGMLRTTIIVRVKDEFGDVVYNLQK